MAFKFNFTSEDLDLEGEVQDQQIESSLHDLSIDEDKEIKRIPSQQYDILTSPLPNVIQADILHINNVETPIYKRTLADVKFQMAQQDSLTAEEENDNNAEVKEVANMLDLTDNSDLIKGVYEGGFKTWECSVDMVEFLSSLPKEHIENKRVLELGCGSSLPSLFLLSHSHTNRVDVQDYNEQVIRYITIPNILLNTVLNVQQPSASTTAADLEDEDSEGSDSEAGEDDDDDDDDEDDRIEEEAITCDAEAEISNEDIPKMLQQVNSRTKAYFGDWSSLPTQLTLEDAENYDMIVTSETIYAEHALPDLINVFHKALKKPDGVCYVAAKTVYFGVGGGILPFCNLLAQSKDDDGDKMKYRKVFESSSTVKREILEITWDI